MTTKKDVDSLVETLHEFLLATGQPKDLKLEVQAMREAHETEEDIATHIVASAYDKLAYGN